MVLGTYHFANPGLDAVKVKQRDIMAADRQKEVENLVSSLAKFKPTKIFVEITVDRQAELDQAYKSFLAGESKLAPTEVHQVGFRLAKALNHPQLYASDYKSDMDFNGLMQFAAKNGMTDFLQRMQGLMQKLGDVFSTWDQKYTVGEILAIHNEQEFLRKGNALYTDMLAVGKHPDYPGADLVAGWYRRNTIIYDNIRRQLKADDRALVIYGSGHVYYLNQLFRDDEKIELVSPSKLLPKRPAVDLSIGQ